MSVVLGMNNLIAQVARIADALERIADAQEPAVSDKTIGRDPVPPANI